MDAGSPPAKRFPFGRRFSVTPAIELGVVGIAIAIGIVSYFAISAEASPERLLPPPLIALLLVANIVPGVALMVLIGRRVARRRAANSPIGGKGQLHVRLVMIFSVIAAVPMILVTVVASLLFQYGVQFWYSDQARGILEGANVLARTNYEETTRRLRNVTLTAANDVGTVLRQGGIDDPRFPAFMLQQIYYRGLSDGIIFTVAPNGAVHSQAMVNPDSIDVTREVKPADLAAVRASRDAKVTMKKNRIDTLAAIPGFDNAYLYTVTIIDVKAMMAQVQRGEAIQNSYRDLLRRARSIQLRFNAALLALSLLIVGFAVWIALQVADRLVRPVNGLVDAARHVAAGDLSARVPLPRTEDEIGTLATAFNQMTERLEQQTGALVTANDQLESRRALIEAVLSGISAGVISVDADRTIRIINSSASGLLGTDGAGAIGQRLVTIAPELDALLDGGAREGVVQVQAGNDPRTLAVRIAQADAGPILTFDDITQQLLDQRRAAWADVARRIAHEIKNPLTPIQLAAERLQRRYGKQIEAGDTTFNRLTETIVRQVGDLRRMVDEFSSFARMPKPVFHAESLLDLGRQALFLHEVAHPGIRFALVHDDATPSLVCDRRQIGQALTNIVKNAVEAIEARPDDAPPGEIVMTLAEDGAAVTVQVADNGIGLPAERDRIVEPYMTTRARGTGLGLAIVKKIVEEHFGTIAFTDRPGGGTIVTMTFDTRQLAAVETDGDASAAPAADSDRLLELTRNRT
jgi:two-component system, NtrC family, nitrogen regulation sensor histidine kinase NtrY